MTAGQDEQRRKVVYILERFPGGTLNFVYNEIRGLESSGYRVKIFSLLSGRACPEEARDFVDRTQPVRPVAVVELIKAWSFYLLTKPRPLLGLLLTLPFDNKQNRFKKMIKTFGHLVYAVYFARMLRESNDHKAHVHAHFAFKAALCGLVASKLNGTTFSFTAHGSATVYPPSQYCLRSKVSGASFVVAVSDFNKNTMLGIDPATDPDDIVVNRTGIIMEEFPYEPSEHDSGECIRIICVASLYPIKNHKSLILACGMLAQRKVNFRLDLIGNDDLGLGVELKGIARSEGIGEMVHFHGAVDHGQVSRHLGDADICILTSFSEGIPVSLMEAMARGISVIGPRVTGVPELIHHGRTGMLADPMRPEEFADAIEELAVDKEARIKMVLEARAMVEQQYDMVENSKKLAEIFDHFLFEKGNSCGKR
jgi:colanic acid/amylovoran biosynthesis glycosyltransferase